MSLDVTIQEFLLPSKEIGEYVVYTMEVSIETSMYILVDITIQETNTRDIDPGILVVSKDQKNCEKSESTHCQVDHSPIIV